MNTDNEGMIKREMEAAQARIAELEAQLTTAHQESYNEAIEAAKNVADEIVENFEYEYKVGMKSCQYTQGQSDGASDVLDAIRALKKEGE